ncbi:MAG TPA: fluoride efflux transporter CrcB [Gemmatimonadales bacterium]
MRLVWYVALGGALGSVARYAVGSWIQFRTGSTFPVGTLVVNLSGSFLLGLILRYALETPAVTPEARALLTTGILGGYTTFSTFTYETATLLEEGDWRRATLYAGLSVLLSLAGAFLGIAGARELLAARHAT